MATCFMIATIISALSIFAFFGNAYANTGGTAIPNMFQLMFGSSGNYSGYIIVWKQYGGLTFLFALEIIIIIMASITWYVCGAAYEDIWKIGCAIFSGICSLVALIISFCTLNITNVDPYGYGVTLGLGPILYSVLNIISVILITGSVIYYFVNESKYIIYRNKYIPKSTCSSSSTSSATSSISTTQANQKEKLTENEKAELLLKYKGLLDSGVITQEEFDSKKKEIL